MYYIKKNIIGAPALGLERYGRIVFLPYYILVSKHMTHLLLETKTLRRGRISVFCQLYFKLYFLYYLEKIDNYYVRRIS